MPARGECWGLLPRATAATPREACKPCVARFLRVLSRYFTLATSFFRKHDQTKHVRRPNLATIQLRTLSNCIGQLQLHCSARRPRISLVGHRDAYVTCKLHAQGGSVGRSGGGLCWGGGRRLCMPWKPRAPGAKDGHSCEGSRKGVSYAPDRQCVHVHATGRSTSRALAQRQSLAVMARRPKRKLRSEETGT